MKTIVTSALTIALVGAFSPPLRAGECTADTTVGNFDVSFEGAVYDGTDTEFTYCITGLDVPDFHALSNWLLALAACIEPDDLVSCGPEPCFYQVNDPHFGLTGIKFDDVVVDVGQTVCFNFSLSGDWSNSLGDVAIGLKAGTESSLGNICGPICRVCEATVAVDLTTGQPVISTRVVHNRPPTSFGTPRYLVVDSTGRTVASWTDGPITMQQGDVYSFDGAIPGSPTLAPGTYTLVFKLRSMSGWIVRKVPFEILQ